MASTAGSEEQYCPKQHDGTTSAKVPQIRIFIEGFLHAAPQKRACSCLHSGFDMEDIFQCLKVSSELQTVSNDW